MVILQARKSNLVPASLSDNSVSKETVMIDKGLQSNIVYQVLARSPQPILAKYELLLTVPIGLNN